MCSDHFESDCFLDPETKTRLRKSVRPLAVPIPTIFECNLGSVSKTAHISPSKCDSRISAFQEVIIKDHCPTDVVAPEPLQDEEDAVEVAANDKADIILDDLVEEIEQEEESLPLACRFCDHTDSSSTMLNIWDCNLEDILELIMPGQVRQEDGLSHIICTECATELRTCEGIVLKFRSLADQRV